MTVRMLAAASIAALVATGALAQDAATHPETGEALAENQALGYSVIDEFPSLDPAMIEDVEGSHAARQLFEGLYNQDAEGNIAPGV